MAKGKISSHPEQRQAKLVSVLFQDLCITGILFNYK